MPQDSKPEGLHSEHAAPDGLDWRVHEAVTDLHAYTMLLESQAPPPDGRIEDELEALRETTAALRERGSADPV